MGKSKLEFWEFCRKVFWVIVILYLVSSEVDSLKISRDGLKGSRLRASREYFLLVNQLCERLSMARECEVASMVFVSMVSYNNYGNEREMNQENAYIYS